MSGGSVLRGISSGWSTAIGTGRGKTGLVGVAVAGLLAGAVPAAAERPSIPAYGWAICAQGATKPGATHAEIARCVEQQRQALERLQSLWEEAPLGSVEYCRDRALEAIWHFPDDTLAYSYTGMWVCIQADRRSCSASYSINAFSASCV